MYFSSLKLLSVTSEDKIVCTKTDGMISGEQSIRKMLEERERLTLSQYAFLSENTQGRLYPLNFDDTRTEFQRALVAQMVKNLSAMCA